MVFSCVYSASISQAYRQRVWAELQAAVRNIPFFVLIRFFVLIKEMSFYSELSSRMRAQLLNLSTKRLSRNTQILRTAYNHFFFLHINRDRLHLR